MKHRLLLLFGFILCCNLYGQDNNELKEVLNYYLINDVENAQRHLDKLRDSKDKEALKWHIDIFLQGVKDTIASENLMHTSTSFSSVLNDIKNAEILKFHYIKKDSLIYEYLNRALSQSKKLNDTSLIRLSYKKFLQHNFDNNQLTDLIIELCEEFKPYIKTPTDSITYIYYKYSSISINTRESQIKHYQRGLELLENSRDNLSKGILNQVIGITEIAINQNFDSAFNYLINAANFYEKVPGFTGYRYSFKINNNLGILYSRNGNPKLGLTYFRKASQYDFGKNNLRQKSNLYLAMSQAHESLKNFDSALYYARKEKDALGEFKEYESALELREIDTKYKTAEKERQILLEQQKKVRNRNIALALGALILFSSLTFVLIQKNTKRKQLLAEQEKNLQTQKVSTLLKEQELKAIDAMISGQEKERQRIANDLHDDLGGLMATVKLHFNALKEKQTPELYNKTTQLLDKAYHKVRSVAHSKNSGVMANKGLLKAIQDMANTVSQSNKLKVEVNDHGLDNRLENSLELTIFRIVQELITNIIKHAQATEASIHITNHGESLNILVEDNGVGFNTKNIPKQSGMGIHSIDRRVEGLDGSVTIESEINKGTTVIIDIPT